MTVNKKKTTGNDLSVDSPAVSQLAENVKLLRSRLKQKEFSLAARRLGIIAEDILPRVVSDFKTDNLISRAECKLRYQHFERTRRTLICKILKESRRTSKVESEKARKQAEREALLQHLLATELEKERRNIERMNRARSKYEEVVHDENARIISKRTLSRSESDFFERSRQISVVKRRFQLDLKLKAKKRMERRQNQIAERKKAEEAYKKLQLAKLEERDRRLKAFKAKKEKARLDAKKRNMEMDLRKKMGDRNGMKKNGDDIAAEKRKILEDRMATKHRILNEKRRQKQEERRLARIAQNIQSEERKQRVARQRRALQFQAEERVKEMESEYARRRRLRDIQQAIAAERRNIQRIERIRRDEWKKNIVLERDFTPGPGHYTLPDLTTQVSGGSWSTAKVKSQFEEIEYQGKDIPGPGKYGIIANPNGIKGGIISQKVTTEMEHMLERAKELPGPGQYQPREIQSNNPQAFPKFRTPGMLEIAVKLKQHVPGPGLYSGNELIKAREKQKLKKKTRAIVTRALGFELVGGGRTRPSTSSGEGRKHRKRHQMKRPMSSGGH
eukprot:g3642.t1